MNGMLIRYLLENSTFLCVKLLNSPVLFFFVFFKFATQSNIANLNNVKVRGVREQEKEKGACVTVIRKQKILRKTNSLYSILRGQRVDSQSLWIVFLLFRSSSPSDESPLSLSILPLALLVFLFF